MSPASLSPQRTESCSNSLSVHSEAVHSDCRFPVSGSNPPKQLLVVLTRCPRSFSHEGLRDIKPFIETVDHLRGSYAAANPSRPN